VTQPSARHTQLLSGRYALGEVIGHGGMAVVYRAHDQLLQRDVAVKLLRDVTAGTAARARFTGEVKALAKLSHPGLITLLDAGTTAGQPYLVMDLVEGTTLADCCQGTALAPERVAAIGAKLAEALDYVHGRGIVHRDVKPANVLLAHDGRVRLGDFGIARLMEGSALHTATGMTIGTAAYLAPEQVDEQAGGGTVSPATDVYSLGLVLLEALTGQRAYPGPPAKAALARLNTPPTIPATLPHRWRALLTWMTAVQPADRPSMGQVAAMLASLTADVDPAAATAELGTGQGLPPRRTAPVTGNNATAETAVTQTVKPRSDRLIQGIAAAASSLVDRGRWAWAHRRHRLLAAVGVVVALLLVLVVMLARGGSGPAGPQVPGNLPPRISSDLRDLHEAVSGG
jgi:eukaryotic-like serine/threonine-protein kinase